MALLTAFSLYSCATIERPNADVCIVNAPNKTRKCYNLKRDYDSDGRLKAGAKAVYRPSAVIEDLNKAMVVDSDTGFEDGLAALKAYIKLLREQYEKGCKAQAEMQ